jgi:putative FmdB family regulatory protein
MPIYSYRCKRCGKTMQKLYNKTEGNCETICAACGSREVDKLATSFFNSTFGATDIYRFN